MAEPVGAPPLAVYAGDMFSGYGVVVYNELDGKEETPMAEDRLYAVRLLWVRDPGLFAEYQEKTKPILARHGVHVERWLVTESIDGNGMEKPDQIVVTWFRSPAAKEAFENDPEFVKVAELRDRAAKLVTVTGRSVFGD